MIGNIPLSSCCAGQAVELMAPLLAGGETCLQIGARSKEGFTRFEGPLESLGFKHFDILEVFPGNVDTLRALDIDTRFVVCGDVRDLGKSALGLPPSHDLIIWWHGPEHVVRHAFLDVLPVLRSRCKTLLVGCPNGFYEQGALYGNHYEHHVYHWKPEELEALGFRVYTCGSGEPDKQEHMFGFMEGEAG